MGCFYVDSEIIHPGDLQKSVRVPGMLVDTGTESKRVESSWVPRALLEAIGIERRKKDRAYQMANGTTITRSVGYAIIRSGGYETVDEVVFAEPGDLPILGAGTLEGFNTKVDPTNKRLVAAGPIPAA